MGATSRVIGLLGRVVDLPSWVQPLLAAIAGAAIAWAYFFGDDPMRPGPRFWIAIGVAMGVIAIAWVVQEMGARVIRRRPLLGVRLMGLWAWWELAAASLGIALGIGIAATVAPKDLEPSQETRAVVSGWAAGLSAAIATALSKRAEDTDDRVGKRVRKAVRTAFEGRFVENSTAWNLIESDPYLTMDGWGREAREERARRLEIELAKPPNQRDAVAGPGA